MNHSYRSKETHQCIKPVSSGPAGVYFNWYPFLLTYFSGDFFHLGFFTFYFLTFYFLTFYFLNFYFFIKDICTCKITHLNLENFDITHYDLKNLVLTKKLYEQFEHVQLTFIP